MNRTEHVSLDELVGSLEILQIVFEWSDLEVKHVDQLVLELVDALSDCEVCLAPFDLQPGVLEENTEVVAA